MSPRLGAPYAVTARIAPVLVAVAPLLVLLGAAAGGLPTSPVGWPASALGGLALYTVASHIGRDAGKRGESDLWSRWGGPPTTQLLRWRTAPPSPVAVGVRHRHVMAAIRGTVTLPTAEDEAAAPDDADATYEVAVGILRARTRDGARFGLLAQENASYGFRRNLLGLRPLGLGASAVGLAAAGALLTAAAVDRFSLGWGPGAATATASLTTAVLWAVIDDAWVRRAAEAYAERLLEAAQVLAEENRDRAGRGAIVSTVTPDGAS